MGYTNAELLEIFKYQPQNPSFWWVDQTRHPQLQSHDRNDLVGLSKKLDNLVLVEAAEDGANATPKFNRGIRLRFI
jgi:hypothetical protein